MNLYHAGSDGVYEHVHKPDIKNFTVNVNIIVSKNIFQIPISEL